MNNTKRSKGISEICNSQRKIRVEEECIFPDYCSDIVRVIRVEAFPVITSDKLQVNDKSASLDVVGRVDFTVIYAGEEGVPESYSFSGSISENIKNTLPADVDGDSVAYVLTPSVENVTCKVQSPRKISAKCDLTLDLRMKGNSLFDCINYENDGRAEDKKCTSYSASVTSSGSEEFDFSEEIKLPPSCPSMERMLSCKVDFVIENTSSASNRINFWGTMNVCAVYLPESEDSRVGIQSFYQPIEFNESVSSSDATSDSAVMLSVVPQNISFEILTDNFGENRVLKISSSYKVNYIIVDNDTIEFTEDIYGVGNKAECQYEKRDFVKYMGTLKENSAVKEKIPLREGIERLEGCTSGVKLKSYGFDNGQLFADYRLTFGGIGIGEGGEVSINEEMDLHVPLNLPTELSNPELSIIPEISASVGYVDSKVTSDGGEISFDILTTVYVFSEDEKSYLSSLTFTEDKNERAGEVFYYPSSGDTLWSVGKRYGVSIKALEEANGEMKRVMIIP